MTSRNNAIFASRFPARNISPVDAAMIKEVLEQIHAAFESLPEHLRILLELAHPHLFPRKTDTVELSNRDNPRGDRGRRSAARC